MSFLQQRNSARCACFARLSLARSNPAFAGTPEFASPEQFAGVGVDIRSDLYSLGVVLWEMVTGHALFRGSPAEVMYRHQHAPLPLEQLEDVPQPVVVLLEVLLEKDPGRRFQNPAELLKVIPTIIGGVDSRRSVTRQSFQGTTVANLRIATRRPPRRLGPKKISVARLPITGSDVFGREENIAFLDAAWANPDVKCRYNRCLSWCGEIYARQPLARPDGGRTLSVCAARFRLVVLQAGKQWGHFVRK